MLVKTYGSAVFGLEATTITIEVNVCTGVNFILVGLPIPQREVLILNTHFFEMRLVILPKD